MSQPSQMVVAIDFGTTFSGYAFSTRAEFESNPLSINGNGNWKPGMYSLKCPTCILFDKNKTFCSFGYEAEDDYTDVLVEKRQNEYYFFRHFKMKLYLQKDVTGDFLIEDEGGKPLSAKTVFAGSIKALKDHLLLELTNRGILGTAIEESEMSWVLTLPTIWSEVAKKFMRSCAVKAGIGKKLTIALEPEAASIYCQCLPMVSTPRDRKQSSLIDVGSKFMVIDIGGGTTDIVVQQKLSDGTLKYLCNSSGENCGGTTIDKELLKLIADVLGEEVMNSFNRDYPMESLDLRRGFEILKQRKQDGRQIRATIPLVAFDKLCNETCKKGFLEVLQVSKHKGCLTLSGDKICVSKELFLSVFALTTAKILSLIEENLRKPESSGLDLLLFVGGFSESFVIQDSIKKAFPDKTIIIPPDGSIAVLKGAVIYGHKPDIIASRIVKYSYGISATERYDPSKHEKNRVVEIDGVKRCQGIFRKLIAANTSVVVGEKRSHTFKTLDKDQDFANFRLFYSPKENPRYTDENDCKRLGEIRIEIQKQSRHKVEIIVDFQFGLTELLVSARQKGTGVESNIHFKYD